jgi:hypothetical protein
MKDVDVSQLLMVDITGDGFDFQSECESEN